MSSGGMFPVTVDVLTKNLTFLEARHRIIANNIANANTPSYKASEAPMDEFRRALGAAIEAHRKDPSKPFVLSQTEHISDGSGGLVVRPLVVKGAGASVLRHDGNNVNLEKEMTDLAENTVLYRTMSDLLRKQFMMLQTAIRERAE